MIPVVTPEEMGEIDADAPEPVEVLIGRAGGAVARAAVEMLGGTYGRRVTVLAGKGNNGNDGRDAARRLRRRGVQVAVVDVHDAPDRLPAADLVVDAAFGTGFRGEWEPPTPPEAPVLAVDIPSGVDGLTGQASGAPYAATRTVTFAAWKPGLLLADGHRLSGAVTVADIGLDASRASAFVVGGTDVARWLPRRPVDAHKWKAAVYVVGGSQGMTGAPAMSAAAAARAGAGYVMLGVPGMDSPGGPLEVVGRSLPAAGWVDDVLDSLRRVHAVVVGPGLGRSLVAVHEAQRLIRDCPVPLVVDGDGLSASATGQQPDELFRARSAPTVLTPHDGEFKALTGAAPGSDRFGAVRELAQRTRCVVVLKGPVTLVGDPDGAVLAVTSGDQRLATAGTGDVLAGMIAALIAQGTGPLQAAAGAAHLHGAAACLGPPVGLVASDVIDRIPAAWSALEPG